MNDLPRSLNVPVSEDAANTVIDPVSAGAVDEASAEDDAPADVLAVFDDEQPVTETAAAADTAMTAGTNFIEAPR
jgi:hypothetical protein